MVVFVVVEYTNIHNDNIENRMHHAYISKKMRKILHKNNTKDVKYNYDKQPATK